VFDFRWLAACGAVLLSGTIQGATGFGFAILSMPLLVNLYDPRTAVGLNVMLSLASLLVLSWACRRDASSVILKRFAGGSLAGAPLGLWVFARASTPGLKLFVNVAVLVAACLILAGEPASSRCSGPGGGSGLSNGRGVGSEENRWTGTHRRGKARGLGDADTLPGGGWGGSRAGNPGCPVETRRRGRFRRLGETSPYVAAGFMSGFLATSISMPGPPVILFLSLRRIPKATFRATLATYFVLVYLVSLILLLLAGVVTQEVPILAVSLFPFALVGNRIGVRIFHRVSQRSFERIVPLLLVCLALYGLARTLLP